MVSIARAICEDSAIEPAVLSSRAEVLARYRRFRDISKQHHSAVLDFLSTDAIMARLDAWAWPRARR